MTMTPQVIKSPTGDEMVVIPKNDYDALVLAAQINANDAAEDAADAAIYLARKSVIGEHDILPPEITDMILRGEKLRAAIRKWRNLTQVALAEMIGISQGALSDIESGRRAVSNEVAQKMAQALDVPAKWII